MLNQIIYLRAGNGRDILHQGNLAMGEGNKIFSVSAEMFSHVDQNDCFFFNQTIGTPKPFYCKISQVDKRESILENAYSYSLSAKGNAVFIKSKYIPRECAKDGRGTFINYGLNGNLGNYPCLYFDAPSLSEALSIGGKAYKIDIETKDEDLEYYEFRLASVPDWLEQVEPSQIEVNSEYSFANIGKFIHENSYEEKLKNAVSFVLRQLKQLPNEKEFIIIRDHELNIRKWIAAIQYAMPVSLALQTPFATRLSNCHQKGNLFFIDQHGKYLMTGRNEQKNLLALIVGADVRDPATKTIRPLPFSEFAFLEDLAENCTAEYFDVITRFDVEHYAFCQEFLSGSRIEPKTADLPALFRLYHYFANITEDTDIKELYLNLITAGKYDITNIQNFDVVKQYTVKLNAGIIDINRRELLQILSIVSKISCGNDTEFSQLIYANVLSVLQRVFKNGEIVTADELDELWSVAINTAGVEETRLLNDLFYDANVKGYAFKYQVVAIGQIRNQAEAEEDISTIKTLLGFYYKALQTIGDVWQGGTGDGVTGELSAGAEYVVNGLYALYVTLGEGDIQYDDISEICELFSDKNINRYGIQLFRDFEHDNAKFKSCVHKCTISTRSYESIDDVRFECECYNNYEDLEQFLSQLLTSKKCPVSEGDLFKMLLYYAEKFEQIGKDPETGADIFKYPAGLKYYEKLILRSNKDTAMGYADRILKSKPSLNSFSKISLLQLIGEKIVYNYEKNSPDIQIAEKLFELGSHSRKSDLLVMYSAIRGFSPRSTDVYRKLTDIYNAKVIKAIDEDYFDNLIVMIEKEKLDVRIHAFLLFIFMLTNNGVFAQKYVNRLWERQTSDGFILFADLIKVCYDFQSRLAQPDAAKPKVDYYENLFAGVDFSHPSVLSHFILSVKKILTGIYAGLPEKDQKYFYRNFNKRDDHIAYFKQWIAED